MTFNCSNCGAKLEIGDEFVGGPAQCPFCLTVVGVLEEAKRSLKNSWVLWFCGFLLLVLIGGAVLYFVQQPKPPWQLVAKKAEWVSMLGIAPGIGIDVRNGKIQPPEAPDGYEFYSDFDTIVFGRDQVFAWKPATGRLLIVTCGLKANGIVPNIDGIHLVSDRKPISKLEGLATPHLQVLSGNDLSERLAATRLETNEHNLRFVFRVPAGRLLLPNKSELRVAWHDRNDRPRSFNVRLASLTITNEASPDKVTWNASFVRSFKEPLAGPRGPSVPIWKGESFVGVDSPMQIKDGEPVLVAPFKPVIPADSRIKNASDAKYLFVPFLRLVRVGDDDWSYELRPVGQKEIKLNYGAVDNNTSEYVITSSQVGQELKPGKSFMPQQEFDVRNRRDTLVFKYRRQP
jgi:hypothetical protein